MPSAGTGCHCGELLRGVAGDTAAGGEFGTRRVCHAAGRATLWQPMLAAITSTKMFREIDGISHLSKNANSPSLSRWLTEMLRDGDKSVAQALVA